MLTPKPLGKRREEEDERRRGILTDIL
jgi:hypothetical protein